MRADSLIRYAERTVPRYTSYPTAAQFTEAVGPCETAAWLAAPAPKDRLSIYVHLPFCAQLCWYCGCHAIIANSYTRVEAYIEQLHAEIDGVSRRLPRHGGVTTLHFGGGTPTLLTPDDFERLVEALRIGFGIDDGAEIAVEIDPRGLSEAMATALGRSGVTRASLGVQDFDPEVQRAINRIQPYPTVATAVDRLQRAGIPHHSFDLLYGLPGQTSEIAAATANKAARLWPDRVAAFGYGHVPHLKRHQRMIDESRLPGPAERIAQAEAIEAVLVAQGYRPVGFDHFAWPCDTLAVAAETGRLHRNFQGYTADPADVLIGLGVSAISSFPAGYAQNTADLKAYQAAIDSGGLATARGIALTREDRLRAAAIERLMCDFTIDLAALCRAHGFAPDALDDALERLEVLARDGMVVIDGRHLTVPSMARRFVRHAAACFDAASPVSPARYSRAV